jgi:SAM-dependent methyltransferase
VSPAYVTPAKESVRSFWENEPCGSKHSTAEPGSRAFFDQIERSRYALEPFISRHARFAESAGQRVLEIGSGLGTDSIAFVRAGAQLTAVDLTEHSIGLVRRRFELEGLSADLRVADAENLPFDDDTFDVVYSWGVIHHTPDPPKAASEALRVLKPGGRLCAMVYARRSWVGIGLWARFALLTGTPTLSLADVIASHMESDGTRAYTRREAGALFAGLRRARVTQLTTPYDRRVGGPLVSLLGPRLGWFLVVEGIKPAR